MLVDSALDEFVSLAVDAVVEVAALVELTPSVLVVDMVVVVATVVDVDVALAPSPPVVTHDAAQSTTTARSPDDRIVG